MATTPRSHDESDQTPAHDAARSLRARWTRRLPWLLLALTLLISGLWVQRLYRDLQRSRRAAANLLWIDMHDVAFPLEAMAGFDPETQEWTDSGRLFQVQQEAGAIQNTARMYKQVIGETGATRFAGFDQVFRLFELMADTINHSDEIADERAAMDALTADMRLLLALFPEELLLHGSATELDQAMATWCDQMQLKTIPSSLTNGDSHLTPCP